MLIDRTYLRDGALLILAHGLASLLVITLFGTNEVMRFSWLLVGPALFLTIRHGPGMVALSVAGLIIGKILQGGDTGELAGNAVRYALVLLSGVWAYRLTEGAALTFNCVADYLRLYGVGLLMALLAVIVTSIEVHFGLLPTEQETLLHQTARADRNGHPAPIELAT